MADRQTLECEAASLVTRRGPDGTLQTLVFITKPSVSIRQLEGGGVEPYCLGPPLQLTDGATGGPYSHGSLDAYCSPVYDDASCCVYWQEGYAIMRLDSRNVVRLAAGSKEESGSADGLGAEARFAADKYYRGMTSDGRGTLYVLNSRESAVRKVAVAGDVARVTTLPLRVPFGAKTRCLTYDKVNNVLLGASYDALYHLREEPNGSVPALSASLIAGQDGVGDGAEFFKEYRYPTVDRHGCAYMCDCYRGGRLWKVDTATRRVTTLLTDLPTCCLGPCILPSGCMALICSRKLLFIHGLGLEAADIPGAASGPIVTAANTLPLEAVAQVLGSSIATIKVASMSFNVHKTLLERHSEYFKGMFSGSFAEGSAVQVELPDADPDCFTALLQFFYGWQVCVPDPLLRPVAELAGRLLVGGVVSELTPRLLAATSPATIAADLLWAEAHNLTGLLPGLKTYFLTHASQAMAAAPDSVSRLIVGSPKLAAEVLGAMAAKHS